MKYVAILKDFQNNTTPYSFEATDSFEAEKRAQEIAKTFNEILITWEEV